MSEMGAAVSLIAELEDVIQRGTRAKRVDTLQRITALFLDGAKSYSDAHVDLFDDVFGLLIEEIETKARAELSRHLAPVGNAPAKLLRTLANDDDIAVAGPVLKYAPRLAETDLVGVATTKSQAHLYAISSRPALGEAVTDVLVRRGDREVAHRVADNRGARISQNGFVSLVKRAEDDGILAEKVGLRPDIPEPMFQELLTKATAVVRGRLLAVATADGKAEIHRVLAKVAKEVGARVGPRDYSAAQRIVLSLERAGRLNETALAAFCGDSKFEETVAALAMLAKVPITVAERFMGGERPDPVLILCRAIGLNWSTVKAIIMLRPDAKSASHGLDSAFANYERLSTSTARRVVRFWQVRQAG
ncbi:MAG TPA: DUF2336 domain-containing protein [Xanthobacteraceae bacterium]|nr:DUF2336 domain-containing protein [Xanthobacteraceae bacterium]